jgi:hypothetical protein
MEKKNVFRSRISVLLTVFILAVFLFVFIPLVQDKRCQDIYILGGVLLFVILTLTGIRYVISGDKLFAKIWFIPCGSAEITKITSIERSYNPLSSPAASLKRLRIDFMNKKSFWLISPAQEQKFIEELKTINPSIHINVSNKKGTWRMQDWDI